MLGLDHVGLDDDFFDLGGYSLITVRLLCHIEERFGRSLEIADIMQASTLSAMAALIVDPAAQAASPVMLLNEGGRRPPLYWLDAGPLMRGLARAVPAGQPVFSLNLTHADEQALSRDTVEIAAVAAILRQRLLAAQPDGPYYIGGWCRWGIVAHELACQLHDEGRDVALLILLDAVAPAGRTPREIARSALAAMRQFLVAGATADRTTLRNRRASARMCCMRPCATIRAASVATRSSSGLRTRPIRGMAAGPRRRDAWRKSARSAAMSRWSANRMWNTLPTSWAGTWPPRKARAGTSSRRRRFRSRACSMPAAPDLAVGA